MLLSKCFTENNVISTQNRINFFFNSITFDIFFSQRVVGYYSKTNKLHFITQIFTFLIDFKVIIFCFLHYRAERKNGRRGRKDVKGKYTSLKLA